jgi:hypothetical protein
MMGQNFFLSKKWISDTFDFYLGKVSIFQLKMKNFKIELFKKFLRVLRSLDVSFSFGKRIFTKNLIPEEIECVYQFFLFFFLTNKFHE